MYRTERKYLPGLRMVLPGLAQRWQNYRERNQIARLKDMDDHLLADVGVTREEVEIATGMTTSESPADALYRMSLSRRNTTR